MRTFYYLALGARLTGKMDSARHFLRHAIQQGFRDQDRLDDPALTGLDEIT